MTVVDNNMEIALGNLKDLVESTIFKKKKAKRAHDFPICYKQVRIIFKIRTMRHALCHTRWQSKKLHIAADIRMLFHTNSLLSKKVLLPCNSSQLLCSLSRSLLNSFKKYLFSYYTTLLIPQYSNFSKIQETIYHVQYVFSYTFAHFSEQCI